jgi:hypothetical protein
MKRYFSLFLALVMLVTAIPFAAITASAADVLKGDVDGNGQVTAIDARYVLRHVAGLLEGEDALDERALAAADMDKDDAVTAQDARRILRQVAGLSNGIYDVDTNTTNDILNLFGYKYDKEQDIYYTDVEAWQREFGFTDIYDDAAAYGTMLYTTLKCDFEYNGLLWRLQWWKGQYGVLEGAELGVYTKKPENVDSAFYRCAEDENLLEMYFEYYPTTSDYNAGRPLFTRYEQEHWWITGFKFGYCDPTRNVVKAVLIAKDKKMADGIEAGLQNLTGKNNQPSGEDFVEYRPWDQYDGVYNFYVRSTLPDDRVKFEVTWVDAGYTNF